MDREKLAENLQTFVPLMFKKIMKAFPASEISQPQIGLLFHVKKNKGKPMSYYSEKMMVPKSNLTVISDSLIKEGYIERKFDPSDRRVIILELTGKGEEFLNNYKEKVREQIKKRLDNLEEEDVIRLNELIEEMKSIFEKIGTN